MAKDFILASSSKQRRALLKQIEFSPKLTEAADIDETPQRFEKPSAYVKRMALEKARHVAERHPGEVVLASDTIIVCGAKIIQKAHSEAEQEKVMRMLSGKAHHVLSGICVIDRTGKASVRCVDTRIVMKRLSEEELKSYVAGHEWDGCAGYRIEGVLGAYVKKIIGSYSGVIGLPLFETKNMLNSAGVK